jgi:DNA-binding CsgD family transcriptional regulator
MKAPAQDLGAGWRPFCRVAPGPPAAPESAPALPRFGTPLQALGGVLLELYPLALGTAVSDFEPRLFDLLRRGISFESGWVGRVALIGDEPVMHNSCLYRLPLEYAEEWERLKRSDPSVAFLQTVRGRPVPISMVETEMSAEFRPFAEKYSLAHALVCLLDDPALGLHTFLSLFRHDLAAPFSRDDMAFVEAVMPHVASATTINRLHQIAQIKAVSGGPRVAVAICDGFGVLQFAESAFAEFMSLEWPDWKGPSLPEGMKLVGKTGGTSAFVGSKISIEARQESELVVLHVRPRPVSAGLTPKERLVTRLFAEGLTYKEVARRLELSPPTVKHHLRNAYAKLGVQSKGEIAWLLSQEAQP